MYEELIGALRFHGSCLSLEAAGVIEKLSHMERDFRQYISDQVKREKGVYACCYCKNRESANKYEPGCSHEECDGVSGWEYGTPKEET